MPFSILQPMAAFMANRMTQPAEGQEKDVLLILDKQQGKEPLKQG